MASALSTPLVHLNKSPSHTPRKVSSQQEDLSLNPSNFKKKKRSVAMCAYNSGIVEQRPGSSLDKTLGLVSTERPCFKTVSQRATEEQRHLMNNSDLIHKNKSNKKAAPTPPFQLTNPNHLLKGNLRASPRRLASLFHRKYHPWAPHLP